MSYTTINKSTEHFESVSYTGNGTSQSVTQLEFQPSLTWIKQRESNSRSTFYDSARGANKRLQPDGQEAEVTETEGLTSFDSNGFSVGSSTLLNTNLQTYVSNNWKGGTTVSNGTDGGQLASTCHVNTAAGFSVVNWTADGTVSSIPHSLNGVPDMIIMKEVDDTSNWYIYHSANSSEGAAETKYIDFNSTSNTVDSTNWNDTKPTSTQFFVGTGNFHNVNGREMVAYCFRSITGYSSTGTYKGNGLATGGNQIYTGFSTGFLLICNTSASTSWMFMDNHRIERISTLYQSLAESSTSVPMLCSNGFKINSPSQTTNGNFSHFVYLAIAGYPLVGTNGVPATAV
tara:strand:+ start:1626 stop:2657 length:1032 start_codon:yes stop_codon:yes gene_type:complete